MGSVSYPISSTIDGTLTYDPKEYSAGMGNRLKSTDHKTLLRMTLTATDPVTGHPIGTSKNYYMSNRDSNTRGMGQRWLNAADTYRKSHPAPKSGGPPPDTSNPDKVYHWTDTVPDVGVKAVKFAITGDAVIGTMTFDSKERQPGAGSNKNLKMTMIFTAVEPITGRTISTKKQYTWATRSAVWADTDTRWADRASQFVQSQGIEPPIHTNPGETTSSPGAPYGMGTPMLLAGAGLAGAYLWMRSR